MGTPRAVIHAGNDNVVHVKLQWTPVSELGKGQPAFQILFF